MTPTRARLLNLTTVSVLITTPNHPEETQSPAATPGQPTTAPTTLLLRSSTIAGHGQPHARSITRGGGGERWNVEDFVGIIIVVVVVVSFFVLSRVVAFLHGERSAWTRLEIDVVAAGGGEGVIALDGRVGSHAL